MITYKNLGRYGRCGNQMFQIAGTIGLATLHEFEYGFPYWKNYDQEDRFGGGEDIDIQKWFKHWLPTMKEQAYNDFNVKWGYHDISIPDNVNIVGHMQSDKYFIHCEELIRHYFKFDNETAKQENTLAIHFRGGDYGGDYHPTCTSDYYVSAFNQMPKGLRILLFTDDPQRASEALEGIDYELVTGNHSMIDMEIMSKCDHHIIANSTFSWWGAWLANSKKVVAPSVWFGTQAKGLETKDLYPENWIKI